MEEKLMEEFIDLELVKREMISYEEYTALKERDDGDYLVYKRKYTDNAIRYFKIKPEDWESEQIELQFKLQMTKKIKRIERSVTFLHFVVEAGLILLILFIFILFASG